MGEEVLLGLIESASKVGDRLTAEPTRNIATRAARERRALRQPYDVPLCQLYDARIAGTAQEIAMSLALEVLVATMMGAPAGVASPQTGRRLGQWMARSIR